MDQKALEIRLTGLNLGGIRYYERLGSTNDEAAVWAEEGAPDLALVVADEQTAGRGRAGRKWITPPSSSLAFSLVLRLTEQERDHFVLPRMTALGAIAVVDALVHQYGLPALIKWPNDVLIRQRKVAGVLAEAQWMGADLRALILGIGVNVTPNSAREAARQEIHLHFPATSVEDELGRPIDRFDLLYAILEKLIAWRPRLVTPDYVQAWEKRLAFRGEWVHIYPGQGWDIKSPLSKEDQFSLPPEGQIMGLTSEGCLQLRTRSGDALTMQVGEIRFLPVGQ